MVVLQTIILKTNPYLKYFLNHKNSFLFFAKHLEKPLILQKNHIWLGVKHTLCDNSDDLKIIFSSPKRSQVKKLEASLK